MTARAFVGRVALPVLLVLLVVPAAVRTQGAWTNHSTFPFSTRPGSR